MDENLISFSNYFKERVKNLELPSNTDSIKGFLFGLRVPPQSTILVNFAVSKNSDWRDLSDDYSKLLCCLPVGIDIVGYFVLALNTSQSLVLDEITEYMSSLNSDANAWPFQNLLLSVTSGDGSLQLFNVVNKCRSALQYDIRDVNIQQSHVIFRLQTVLPLHFEYHSNEEKFFDELTNAVQSLKQSVTGDTIALRVDSANILILPEKSDSVSDYDDENDITAADTIYQHSQFTCKRLLDMLPSEDSSERSKCRKAGNYSKEYISLKLLLAASENFSNDNLQSAASPIIHHTHRAFQCIRISLPIDIVGHIAPTTTLGEVRTWFLDRLQLQLEAALESMLHHSANCKILLPRPYHFWPDSLPHMLTITYPDNKSDDELQDQRYEIQNIFSLPVDRPLLRRLNAYRFSTDRNDGHLVDPHLALPTSQSGDAHLVQGSYVYHHYMQDRIDDNGWGCAYRSLQTLISWFRCQGYTDKLVPSHREIQQILVDVGDKQANFVGSRQWIGSTEVSYVLDTYIGVTSRILHVSQGSEMASKSRELVYHFDNQGTPIMIGGGMYAHTILGIEYNEQTGQVKYLILDPHYTGPDVIKQVIERGGCFWKGPEFWEKSVFYNMCLPQRPKLL